jgi:hypothetical protein
MEWLAWIRLGRRRIGARMLGRGGGEVLGGVNREVGSCMMVLVAI